MRKLGRAVPLAAGSLVWGVSQVSWVVLVLHQCLIPCAVCGWPSNSVCGLHGSTVAQPQCQQTHLPCLPVQARGFEEVYQLLREVPRLARQTGSSSVILCGGGLLTDDIVRFGEERAQWESRCETLSREAALVRQLPLPGGYMGVAGLGPHCVTHVAHVE